MNAKPKNHRALVLACFHCTFPGSDVTDTTLLTYLAENADHGTGQNARPGNLNIADALKLKERAAKNRLKLNIERGLIERTERGDGPGNASVYRICWESPHFPDRTPGGEELTGQSTNARIENRAAHECPDREPNRAAEGKEPGSQASITGQSDGITGQSMNCPPPVVPPESTTTSTAQKSNSGGGGRSLENKYMATIGSWGKRNLERLDAEVKEHGYEAVDKALAEILRDGLGECTSKSGVALSRLPEKLAKHKADAEAAIQKVKDEEAQAKSIERQTQELIRRRDSRPDLGDGDGDRLFYSRKK